MPTVSEFIALGEAVTTAVTANYQGSGVAGIICTDKTDSSKVLFFPACDYANYGIVNSDYCGYYWSSSLRADYGVSYTFSFILRDGVVYWDDYYVRYYGFPVRGVVDE
jgi:hypothetical protein